MKTKNLTKDEYEPCTCGSKKTYESFSGDICCLPCFKSLKKKVEEAKDNKAIIVKDDDGWAVKVGGATKKYFSKYEDYACTEARSFARKLNTIAI